MAGNVPRRRARDRRSPEGSQGQRVPGGADPRGRARAGRRRTACRGGDDRGPGFRDRRRGFHRGRGPDRAGCRRRVRRGGHDREGEGAAAPGVRTVPERPGAVHLPAPGGRRDAHPVLGRPQGAIGRVRDRPDARRPASAAGAHVRDRWADGTTRGGSSAGTAPRRTWRPHGRGVRGRTRQGGGARRRAWPAPTLPRSLPAWRPRSPSSTDRSSPCATSTGSGTAGSRRR